MNSLYNCVTIVDFDNQPAYRITKFTDGNVESSYITTRDTCNCPAGVRPTCRHRQMLPEFLNRDLVNTPWFMEWDCGHAVLVCDFQGNLRPAAPACPPNPEPTCDHESYNNIDCLCYKCGNTFQPNPEPATQTTPAKSWRRM